MRDLERLTEALTDYENAVHKSEVVWDQKSLVAAARVYRDLLANGKRERPEDQRKQWVRAFNAGYRASTKDLLANGERLPLRRSSLFGWVLVFGNRDTPRPESDAYLVFPVGYPTTEEER